MVFGVVVAASISPFDLTLHHYFIHLIVQVNRYLNTPMKFSLLRASQPKKSVLYFMQRKKRA